MLRYHVTDTHHLLLEAFLAYLSHEKNFCSLNGFNTPEHTHVPIIREAVDTPEHM